MSRASTCPVSRLPILFMEPVFYIHIRDEDITCTYDLMQKTFNYLESLGHYREMENSMSKESREFAKEQIAKVPYDYGYGLCDDDGGITDYDIGELAEENILIREGIAKYMIDTGWLMLKDKPNISFETKNSVVMQLVTAALYLRIELFAGLLGDQFPDVDEIERIMDLNARISIERVKLYEQIRKEQEE